MATADAIQTKAEADTPPQGERLRTRTIIVALIFAFVAVIWAREAELVAFACQITESVPPMTALGGLLVFVVLSIGLRKAAHAAGSDSAIGRAFGWLSLSGQQNMYIYAFITIATIVFSVGVIRTLLPEMTTLTYFADYSNDYAEALPHANQYLHVTDSEAVRQLYEGSDEALTGAGPGGGIAGFLYAPIWRTTLVPWGAWAVPLLTWSLFILVLFGTMQCVAALAEREWTLSERLPYPLVEIPLGITEQRSFITSVSFLRDPVMWGGFILGASYGIHEMIAATTFAFPLLGREHALGNLLTEHPWSAIGGNINIFLMPEAYGLAYFAPQDVLLTTSLSWIGINLFRVATAAGGYDVKPTAYRDATAGSFVGLVLAALWVARRPLIESLGRAFGRDEREADELPADHVWLMRGALAGMALMFAFWLWTGLPWYYVIFAVFMFMVAAVGHARVRAIAGAATPWLFPHSGMTETFVRLAGANAIGGEEQWRPFTALFNMRWVDRGYPHSALASQLEGYNMTRRGGMEFRDMTKMLLLAVPVGLVIGWWMHLTVFYDHGANVLGGGTGVGGVRVRYANTDATWALGLAAAPTALDPSAWWGLGTGLVLTTIGLVIRNIFLQVPFHPAGLVIAFSHGRRFWAPFGIVWAIKGALLRIGGVASYRRLMPGFLGIVIGHYFFTGIVMGLAKMTGLAIFDKLPIIWF
ncbi:MAG: DUF6785 family protein [Armatimonadota bacterium]|jgi:hypothetical protein